MVSFNLLTGGLTMCFAVSLYRCEVGDDNYNTLLTKLKNGLAAGNGKDHIHKSDPDLLKKGYGCYKQDAPTGDSHVVHYDEEESMLAAGLRDLRFIYNECQNRINKRLRRKYDGLGVEDELLKMREKVISLYKCIKVFSFRQFDDFLSDDVVPVSTYLEFVRDVRNETNSRTSYARMRGHPYAAEILSKDWLDLIMERIGMLLHGHSLKFRLGDDVTQGRGRRRDHRMFAMMMMGFVIMASILVPMGFQFLTVLGGKSLLMAKMALIMSAINGLKKIATSNVGYGLYHAGPEAYHHDPHHHGFHDKIFHIKAPQPPESPFNVVI